MSDASVDDKVATLNGGAGGNPGGGTRSTRANSRRKKITLADEANAKERELAHSQKDERRAKKDLAAAEGVKVLGAGLMAIADTEDKKKTARSVIAAANINETTKRGEYDTAVKSREAKERELAPLKADLEAKRTAALKEETKRRGVMRPLCTGRLPQNPVLIKARIDPKAVFGRWHIDHADFPPEYYACPQYVPVFTSVCGLKHMYGDN